MRIRDYLTADRIDLRLDRGNKAEVLRRLVGMLAGSVAFSDPEALLREVMRREDIMSTGVGDGVAIPHAAADGVPTPSIALGVAPGGVDFHALDGKPVHVIFLLVGSRDSPDLQLKALARIARLTKHGVLVNSLRAARSPDEALAIIEREDSLDNELAPPAIPSP
jgi:mannitol/fructose-specific phosphotransferase system IIA component (Ntr-type)